jgi:hypothetical protein
MRGLSVRRPPIAISVALAFAMAAAIAVGVAPGPEPADAAVTGKLAPPDAALFGAYVGPTGGWHKAAVQNAITTREQQLGRRFDISQEYYSWGKSFPTWRQGWDLDQGRIPLISWSAVKTTAVNAGTHDAYIRARADGVKALGAPIFLRWFSEMDGDYQKEEAVSPSAFITAWRRIYNIFNNRGATNVVWVWCPTAWGFERGTAGAWYPGDQYVDWICTDGFNWAPKREGATWRSFESVFQAFYNWGSAHGKPLMVGETGTEEDPLRPGRKAQWVLDARNALKMRMPNIKAFVYFDTKRTHETGTTFDWRMNTTPGALQAFRGMAQDQYFRWTRSYRPDALVRGEEEAFVGEDVYADEGAQTARSPLNRRRRAGVTIRIENDGNIGDVFRIREEESGKRLRVRYFLAGSDVTEQVRSGELLTTEIAPGSAVDLRVAIKVPKKGRAGKLVRVSVTSGSNKNVRDTVGTKLRRRPHAR